MNDSVLYLKQVATIKDLQFEIAKLTSLLEQEEYKAERAYQYSAQLDKGWNKTCDAHEVTKQRLLKYENEVGTPHNKGISDHRLGGAHKFYDEFQD